MNNVILLFLLCLVAEIRMSAIPMWEFLSKQEKMSYLYSMFQNQVEDFCEKNTMENCNAELMKYGLKKLKAMPEDHLDTMDPYQKDANSLIWDSMMEGHEMMKNPKPRPPTPDYDNAASLNTFNTFSLPPPKGFVYTIRSGTPEYIYPTQPHTGPVLTKVHRDGTPVVDNKIHEDEDLHQYKMAKVQIPNF